MADLVVDTSAQRVAAAGLRAVGRSASDLHARGDRLAMLAPGVGAPEPARAVGEFLGAWSYGMGVIGHQVAELAGMLEGAAVAFEAVEAHLTASEPPGPSSIPVPDPPPLPAPVGARWGDVPWTRVPVQLSAAKSPRQLIPGEPQDVDQLAAATRDFAVTAADGANALGALTLGGWVGAAATVFAAELDEAPRRLHVAVEAFAQASTALRRHAAVLSDAQLVAAVALQMWQETEAASQMWRGVTIGPDTLPPSDTDPGLDGMARAAAVLARAREDVAESGLALVSVLDEAASTAPKDPGLLARFARTVRGFAGGLGEGGAGILTGAVGIVGLAARLNPARALVDPHGYLDAVEKFGAGVAAAATHPRDTLAAVTDWHTWTTDPARAAGRLAPDLLLAIATAGAGTAARAASRAGDLGDVSRLGPATRAVDDLRLPRDAAKPLECRRTCGDPVDVASGDVILAQTDVTLPGLLALVLSRTHVSSYRLGRWFGPSWASTLDQRVEVEPDAVHLIGEDGTRLVYPVPADGQSVLPAHGPQRPLTRTDTGWAVTDSWSGRTLHFSPGPDPTASPLRAITDRNSHRVEFDYTEDGAPAAVRHSGGYQIRVETEAGRVTALRLHTGEGEVTLVRYGYDQRGNLAEIVNSSGMALRLTYDQDGRLASWRDRNDVRYAYRYDESGRCIATTGDGGYLDATFAHDPTTRTTTVTDSLGHATEFGLDDAGRVVREVDALGHATAFDWNERDRLLARTDPLGRITRHTWDSAGDLVAITRADGLATAIGYDDRHLPIEVVHPDGARWAYAYDRSGNLVATTDPLGATTSYAYADGSLTEITDALGFRTRIDNDPAGLPTAVTEPTGARTRYDRDAFGRVSALTDPVGGVTHLSWTVEGKLATRTLPDGASERWDYDGEGNPRTHTDPLGQTTTFEYTSFDLPAARTGPDGACTTYTYDTELRLVAVTDPAGLVWSYQRDAVGNIVAETDVNGRHLRYAYDPARQLVASVNGVDQTTRITRDDLGNVTERRSPDAVTTFAYDAAGRLVGATNPDATLTFDRDALGRVTAETCNGAVLTSTYDALGRRTHRRTPAGVESRWDYGPGAAPLALHTAGTTVAYAYDPAGRQIEQLVGDHTVLTKTWDANHRLLTQSVGDSIHRAYRYRADGNLVGIDDSAAGPRTFDLDPVGRVLTARGPDRVEEYSYDLSGNVVPRAHGSDGFDQVGTLVRRAGRDRYEHDAGGRTVLRQRERLSAGPATWHYTWDADDRLVAVTTPDGTRWRYRYDPLGRRIAKERLTPDGSDAAETTCYTWDGSTLAEQARTGTESDVRRTITWDYEPGSFRPIGQRLRSGGANDQAGVDEEFFAIATDLIGTPSELVALDGTLSALANTTLWGAQLGDHPVEQICPLRFPGQYYDAETSFHYNHHRYFSPSEAQYVSPDPLGLLAGPNPIAYVLNPTTWTDPLGLMSCTADPITDPRTLDIGGGTFPGSDVKSIVRTPDGVLSVNPDITHGPSVVGRSQQLPFADRSFSSITMNHFPSDQFGGGTLSEAARVIRPGGSLSITTGRRADVASIVSELQSLGFITRVGRAEGGMPWITATFG